MVEPVAIDSLAVRRQSGRRLDPSGKGQFLAPEVARRMLERLDYVRIEPGRVLDAGAGLGASSALLQQRFPRALTVGVDLSVSRCRRANAVHGQTAREGLAERLRSWFAAASGAESPRSCPSFIGADAAQLPLATGCIDLIWSNLLWPWLADPDAVLGDWMRVIRPGGLVMISALGVGCNEALARVGLDATPLPDMHDIGDALVRAGFADPVMDVEHLEVTWERAQDLLADVHGFAGDGRTGRARGLRGRAWRQGHLNRIEAARGGDGLLRLRLELIQGQAWCPSSKRLPAGLAPVRFASKQPRLGSE